MQKKLHDCARGTQRTFVQRELATKSNSTWQINCHDISTEMIYLFQSVLNALEPILETYIFFLLCQVQVESIKKERTEWSRTYVNDYRNDQRQIIIEL